jgi:phosphomannomutase/phosphoglucomutase
MICEMLARSGKSLADMYGELQHSWTSPTMSPQCADDKKYAVVESVCTHLKGLQDRGERFAGKAIAGIITVNGVRVMLEDGSWGLIRTSSNKPELVIVCESLESESQMRDVFGAIEDLLQRYPEVGAYNQKI